MLFIENSYIYGYYLGIAGMIIGLIFGYDYVQKKNSLVLKFNYYEYYIDLLQSIFVGWFVGFFVGFLIPIIFNFLLIILVMLLVILVGLCCLKLFN